MPNQIFSVFEMALTECLAVSIALSSVIWAQSWLLQTACWHTPEPAFLVFLNILVQIRFFGNIFPSVQFAFALIDIYVYYVCVASLWRRDWLYLLKQRDLELSLLLALLKALARENTFNPMDR